MPRRNTAVCVYCGPGRVVPQGYDYIGAPYECLRKGVGVGKFGERRKWQFQTGARVDPEYRSPCPRVANGRSRSPRSPRRGRNRRSYGPRSRSRNRSGNSRSRNRSRSRSRSSGRLGSRSRRNRTRSY